MIRPFLERRGRPVVPESENGVEIHRRAPRSCRGAFSLGCYSLNPYSRREAMSH